MPEEESIQARQERLASIPRACEACKLRRIRCDRNHPCSSCQSAGIACQKPTPRREHQPKNNKINQLEEHVRRLETRIVALESQSQSHTPLNPSALTPAHVNDVQRAQSVPNDANRSELAEPYEGSSSFTVQSLDAHQIAYSRAAKAQSTGHPKDIPTTLQALLNLTASQLETQYTKFASSSSTGNKPEISLIPVEIVVAVIREIKRRKPTFLYSWVLDDTSLIETLCRSLYFPTEPLTVGHLTSTYGILYFIGKEFLLTQSSLCNEFDLHAFTRTCEDNFDIGLKTHDILAQPSFHSILGLTLGVIKTYNQAKSFTCSMLLSSAITHCQLLGYHRESTYTKRHGTERKNARRLFWTLYVFERTTSLLFGRPLKLHDFDIDTKYPETSANPGAKPWDESFIAFIKLAKLQGQAYQRFYSVEGASQPLTAKMEHVEDLAVTFEQWKSDLDSIPSGAADHAQILNLSRAHWELIYLSTKTLLLRAPSIGTVRAEISPSCFDTARKSLQSCLECFVSYQEHGVVRETEFANSFLLFTSFAPFIIIFIHAITTLNANDVILLEKIANLLEQVQDASQEIKRMHRICSTFSSLASSFVEVSISGSGFESRPEDGLQPLNETPWHTFANSDFFQDLLGEDLLDTPMDLSHLDL
ncbi:hypothetical protein M426DRAFT_316141 [Hypoxylon sp. CI-4A]|nr:hypothetical protein M426DRAFT_316141 [Hypoxylon sp. CI-4A]